MKLEALLTREINDLFDETFEQVKGIYLDRGTSLFETLATVSAEEASVPVSDTCASIAAQVDHVRFYLDVLERAMRGEEIGEINWDDSWTLRLVSDEEWAELNARLRESYRSVRELAESLDDWSGDNQLADTLAVIVHTAYHLGEIRQALCTVKQ